MNGLVRLFVPPSFSPSVGYVFVEMYETKYFQRDIKESIGCSVYLIIHLSVLNARGRIIDIIGICIVTFHASNVKFMREGNRKRGWSPVTAKARAKATVQVTGRATTLSGWVRSERETESRDICKQNKGATETEVERVNHRVQRILTSLVD